jgi:hypothetical protein
MINEYATQYEAAKEAAKKASYNGGTYAAPKSKVLTLWSTTPKAWTKYDADGKPVAQKNTPGTGHCTFTAANYLTVAKFATDAAKNGQITWDGAARKAVRASKGLVVDTNYVPALLKFYN